MLDAKDKQLLYALDVDARQPASHIAQRIKLSKEATLYRIRRLEHEGILLGTGAVVDLAKLGYTVVRTYVKLQKASFTKKEEIITYLVEQTRTVYVAELEGNQFDISLGFAAASMHEFEAFFHAFQLHFKAHLQSAQTSVFTQVLQFDRAYLAPQKTARRITQTLSHTAVEAIDDIDRKILSAITKDARCSLLALAKIIDVPARTLTFRVQQLEKKHIIVGYKPNIALAQIGMSYYKVDIRLDDVSILPSLIEYSTQHPNIVYVDKMIAGSDFEFDVEVETKEAFFTLMRQLTDQFPQIVDWCYFNSVMYRKLTYFF